MHQDNGETSSQHRMLAPRLISRFLKRPIRVTLAQLEANPALRIHPARPRSAQNFCASCAICSCEGSLIFSSSAFLVAVFFGLAVLSLFLQLRHSISLVDDRVSIQNTRPPRRSQQTRLQRVLDEKIGRAKRVCGGAIPGNLKLPSKRPGVISANYSSILALSLDV